MSVTVSKEKARRLGALADNRGVVAALSMAHRGSLRRALAEARAIGEDEVTDEMLREVKLAVSKALTPHASAIVLDPEWGLPAAEARAPGAGLLLCYGQSGYDRDRPGRLADLLEDMSARRLKELGADAVRVLLHYSPLEDEEVNDRKHAFVERIGAECRAEELPFVLELVAYDVKGGETRSLELAKRKPEIVAGSIRELSKERYAVDLLGVEVPVDLRYARGSSAFGGESAYSKEQALDCYRAAAEAAQRPFVYSSAGEPTEQVAESLHWAAEAGVSFAGAVCGRAVWGGGIETFAGNGVAAFEDWLTEQGAKNLDAVNAALANASAWYSFYGASSVEALTQ